METTKTLVFITLALVSLIAVWATQPRSADLDVQSLVGENLTKKFSDPASAKRLRIVRFNEDTATLREFEVSETEGGLWTIPSKNGYPADAQRQMAEAATSLLDREILFVASQNAADHEQYGVIDPLSPKLQAGEKGVGTRVIMSDALEHPLVDLIIGHPVKDAENQRFVREAGRDVVYVIEIDPDKLSTDFEDWIEQDLLSLNTLDLRQLQIKDYSAEMVPVMTNRGLAIQVAWEPRTEMTLGYDEGSGNWSAIELRSFDSDLQNYTSFTINDDQELNAEALNNLKSALDDLRIVDVARKPAGLSANLQAGEDFLSNPEARSDLRERGFAAVTAPGKTEEEIISSEGEVICTLKNGVEYVLRFGNLQLADKGGEQPQQTAAEPAAASNEGVHRYLFVMARLNEDVIPKPDLEDLPELPESTGGEGAATATEDADTTADASAATEEPPADEAGETAGEETDAESATEKSADDALEQLQAQRQRIEKSNQRKLDEYQRALDQAREQVAQLNTRFGDWYYVIENDVFQKIRLGRDEVIKQKEATEAAEQPAADASDFGAPGQSIPGLPAIPGAGS